MPNKEVDVAAFNAFEKKGWQHSADPYHHYFGSLTAEAGAALLDAMDTSPAGKALLDLATGPGYLALQAVRRGYAPVVGIDFSDAMVALARQVARDSAAAVEFRSGDAEALLEAADSYDSVTMNFGLLHLGQPQRALAEACRVLKAGGRFGFTVWSGPQRSLGFAVILAAIEAFADPSVAIPQGPLFFFFSTPANSVAAMEAAGFRQVKVESIELMWALDSAEALFEAFLKGTARTGGTLRAQTPATLDRIRQFVMRDAERFRIGTGIRIPMSVVITTGSKPA